MFETLFIDLPTAFAGYALVVFVLMKILGDDVHDVVERSDQPSFNIANLDLSENQSTPIDALISERDIELPQVANGGSINCVEHSSSDDELPAHVPTDSLQRRHFITHLFTLATDVHPRPEDPKNHRNHLELVNDLVERMLQDPERIVAMERLRLERLRSLSPTRSVSDASPPLTQDQVTDHFWLGEKVLPIPQDATLRRHYIQWLAAAWEETYPRPTDATLRRHYDQWLESEIELLA